MKKRGLLIGAFWFTMYTTFFAILSLVYFVLENPDKPGTQEILVDAIDGKDALKGLAKGSQAADRCSIALQTLFEKLPEKLKNRPVPTASKKKRQAPPSSLPGPRVARSTSDLHSELSPPLGVSRATTFPTPVQNGLPPRNSLDDIRAKTNAQSNPNLHNYQDLRSSTDMSAVGTPDSSSTGNSIQRPQYNAQPLGANNGLSDLGAMMFPSADPFAYPNQPMMEFDNIKQEHPNNLNNGLQVPPMFLSNGTGNNTPGLYDDLEGQLFGPFPPYLMQGQQQYGALGQMDAGVLPRQNPQDMNYQSGVTPNNDLNFDGIFSNDGDEWSNMLADQRYG